jgi:hypothetical protein
MECSSSLVFIAGTYRCRLMGMKILILVVTVFLGGKTAGLVV